MPCVADNGLEFVINIQNLTKLGYIVNQKLPVELLRGYMRAYMIKPDAQQANDLKIIAEEVEVQYRLELQQLYEQHLANIVAESKQRHQTEQLKKAEQEMAALEAKWLADATKALGKSPTAMEDK